MFDSLKQTTIRPLAVLTFLMALFYSGSASTDNNEAHRAMVSAAHELATQAGIDILNRGGSAVDAAVTVQTVLNLVEPQSSGIGGGAFMVYFDAMSGDILTYDGRETAPKLASPELFVDDDGKPLKFFDAVVGGLSVGTPGTIALLGRAHAEHGRLPWVKLFDPAIELARDGFPVGQRLAGMLAGKVGDRLKTFSQTRQFYFPNDTALKAGEIVANEKFANALSTIAEQGPSAFYHGQIAKNVVQSVQNAPGQAGFLAVTDFQSYRALQRPPVCHSYRSYRICGMGPPSSGGIAIGQILGILEHFDLASMGAENPLSWHLIVEASKLAFADRNQYVADSDFVRVPVDGLLNKQYLHERAQLIDLHSAMSTPVAPGQPPGLQTVDYQPDTSDGRSGTSHFSIIDRQGNAVSMTTTIEGPFGSQLMVHGFMLNNELTDFSFVPKRDGQWVANRVQPGKRPRSSMSPTIVLNPDNSIRLVIGSPGGSRIIGYVAKTLVAVLDWNMPVQSAIDLANVVNRNGSTDIEEGGRGIVTLQAELAKLGHDVRVKKLTSGLHGIEIVDHHLRGGADPRREGVALGN